MSFQNKVVIVTGSSSGIGAATAIGFASEGAKVTMVGRNTTKLARVAAECERKGSKPLVIVGDVSIEEDCRRIIDDTLKEFGKIDILVNNAGIAPMTSILAPNAMDIYDETMGTNLNGVVYLTHLAVPHLVDTRGNVVNISSTAAQRAEIFNSFSYCISKAGLDHFTRAIALELAPKGVRVNTVAPGPVRTDRVEKAGVTGDKVDIMFEMVAKHVPLRKIGEPEELADLIMFVASHKARSITGCTYTSDNGSALCGPPLSPEQIKEMLGNIQLR